MKTKPGIALLLIDFINPLDFPGASRLAPWAIKAARHTRLLKQRAQALGIPCIYVNDNFKNWHEEFSDLVARCLGAGGPARTLAELLAPEPRDFVLLKPRHSAFYGTPLAFLLEELEVSRLILTGLAGDICVFFTAQDAYVRKFSLWIPANCIGAQLDSHYRSTLDQMRRNLKATTRPAGRTVNIRRMFRAV